MFECFDGDFARPIHGELELCEGMVELFLCGDLSGSSVNLLVDLPCSEFLFVEQSFGEFFAGSNSGELDIDIVGLLESREFDHVSGEVEDLDGLSHFEDEDISGFPDRTGLEYELYGFGDGHEEPFHIAVSDG